MYQNSTPATRLGGFTLPAPLERVMPLFTAQGERRWAPGWEPMILSGDTERGSAFITRGHGGAQVTWIVIDYRPEAGRASYARLVEDSNIGLVDVVCSRKSGLATEVSVRYTLTALSDAGRHFVAQFLRADHYAQMIEEWRDATTRTLLESPDVPAVRPANFD